MAKTLIMELLKTDFTRKGVRFRQLGRTEKAALYEVCRDESKQIGYEVFLIKIAKAHTWPTGDTTPEHEAYPGDNAFGKTAWYMVDLEKAQKRMEKLSKATDE